MPLRQAETKSAGTLAIAVEKGSVQLSAASAPTVQPPLENNFERTPSPESATQSDGIIQDGLGFEQSFASDTPTALFALISVRERPRLAPHIQPYNSGWRERIESLETTRAVKIALHLLNDDLESAHGHLFGVAARRSPDPTCNLLAAVRQRRNKVYFEAEELWRSVKHPLVDELYGEWNGPVAFQQVIEKNDGRRVSEAKRKSLEEAQFEEMRRIAEYAIQEVALK